MIVQPPKGILESIGSKMESPKNKSNLTHNGPKIAAEVLTSKEQLALFYGKSPESEVTAAAVVYAAQALVAATAVAVAVAVKASFNTQRPLDIQATKPLNCCVDDLLRHREEICR